MISSSKPQKLKCELRNREDLAVGAGCMCLNLLTRTSSYLHHLSPFRCNGVFSTRGGGGGGGEGGEGCIQITYVDEPVKTPWPVMPVVDRVEMKKPGREWLA